MIIDDTTATVNANKTANQDTVMDSTKQSQSSVLTPPNPEGIPNTEETRLELVPTKLSERALCILESSIRQKYEMDLMLGLNPLVPLGYNQSQEVALFKEKFVKVNHLEIANYFRKL